MIIINAEYKDLDGMISIKRSAGDEANFKVMIGEMIYGIEVQRCDRLVAHDEFSKCEIPDGPFRNCTVLDDSNKKFELKITMSHARKAK